MKEVIEEILETAVLAPSGENSQPWRFAVRGNEISLYNIPERDLSLYNFHQRGSFIANGTVIENISIAALALGFSAKIELLPDGEGSDRVALISLKSTAPRDEPLYPFIARRSSNRKPYKALPLSQEQLKELTSGEVEGAEVYFTEDPIKIKTLAQAASTNEKVMFNNKLLHNFFFSHLNWTEEEEQEKRMGFYIKTLELPRPAEIGLRLFKHWSIMKVFNKFGMARMIAEENTKIFSASAAMGIIVVENDTLQDFIKAGRLMQRVWLKATKMGLSIQPLTGVLFFKQRIEAGDTSGFSPEQIGIIKEANYNIANAFGVKSKTISMLFRIGDAEAPSARSLKLPPQVIYEGN